jgi:hypothetical protein
MGRATQTNVPRLYALTGVWDVLFALWRTIAGNLQMKPMIASEVILFSLEAIAQTTRSKQPRFSAFESRAKRSNVIRHSSFQLLAHSQKPAERCRADRDASVRGISWHFRV